MSSHEYRGFFPTLFVKKKKKRFSACSFLFYYFEQTRTVTIFEEHGIMAFSKIQLVVYYQCCVLIGGATTMLYVIAY